MTHRDDAEVRRQFEDWKTRALEVDLLGEARARGAQLKRAGTEWVGPCPVCGGRDRFGIHPGKRVFVCRGAGGGDVIAMVMHLAGVDFLGACEQLTGEPAPRGKGKEISAEERAERDRRRAEHDERSRRDAEAEAKKREEQADWAAAEWTKVRPLDGTLAERYLAHHRGIAKPPFGWPDVVGFHPGLVYRMDPARPRYPALVGRIQDVSGDTVAIHAIFLGADGDKLNRDQNKLTYGPMQGGAIRLGGVADHVNPCEGLETGLAIWWMIDFKQPVWPTLGTSGLRNLEFPLEVRGQTTWPDGDNPIRMKDGEYIPIKEGAGIAAARALHERSVLIGMSSAIAAEPPNGRDYLNIYNRLVTHDQA